MTDPTKFRYDNNVPPAGLKPTVGKKPPRPDFSAQREVLKEQLKQVVSQPKKPKSSLFDLELKHPAEGYEDPMDNTTVNKYKMPLSEALQSPDMKSIKYGVIGLGQAGGRIAEQFWKFGYKAIAINTAEQDLAFLSFPNESKLHLPFSLGGAGKNQLIGQQAAEANFDKIKEILVTITDIDQLLVCVAGSGGSGAGSLVPVLQAISEIEPLIGLPISVIFALPTQDEGAIAKSNAIKTLDRISKMVNDSILSALIIVDNAKIQQLYPDVSIADFWKLANFDIVNHFNIFNTVSKCATNFEALDPMDFANIVSSGGCLIYGRVEVEVEKDGESFKFDEQALAEAIVQSASQSVLAEGFDTKQAVSTGVIITGSEKVLAQLPAVQVNYAFNSLLDTVGSEATVYRGIYTDDTLDNKIIVYTIFSGLGLPSDRINQLRSEAEQSLAKMEKPRVKLAVDTKTSTADVYAQMKQRATSLGRMVQKRGPR